MTNHWRDIKNTDLILINGANPAEAHPVGFQWFMRAKLDRGAKLVHADPRFTRTSAASPTGWASTRSFTPSPIKDLHGFVGRHRQR